MFVITMRQHTGCWFALQKSKKCKTEVKKIMSINEIQIVFVKFKKPSKNKTLYNFKIPNLSMCHLKFGKK